MVFFAVEYLLASENDKPHIIVTDNNMESFYSKSLVEREMQQQSNDDKTRIDKKAGCELGKFLRPERIELGDSPSIYNFECIRKDSKKRPYTVTKKNRKCFYEHIDYECTYSDELSAFSIEPFYGLVFLSTSDSAAELGPKNVALFHGLPPKLRYVQIFSKFIDENELRIDKVISRY